MPSDQPLHPSIVRRIERLPGACHCRMGGDLPATVRSQRAGRSDSQLITTTSWSETDFRSNVAQPYGRAAGTNGSRLALLPSLRAGGGRPRPSGRCWRAGRPGRAGSRGCNAGAALSSLRASKEALGKWLSAGSRRTALLPTNAPGPGNSHARRHIGRAAGSASRSTTCRGKPSSGRSICASTAPHRTAASGWASSARWPGSAGWNTSARPSPFRACCTGCIRRGTRRRDWRNQGTLLARGKDSIGNRCGGRGLRLSAGLGPEGTPRAYPAANSSSRIFEAGGNRLDGLSTFDSMHDSLISEWDGNPSYPLSTRVL